MARFFTREFELENSKRVCIDYESCRVFNEKGFQKENSWLPVEESLKKSLKLQSNYLIYSLNFSKGINILEWI